jgi:hypothetical protein
MQVVLMTTKGEAIAIGVAQLTTSMLATCSRPVTVAKTKRVIMERDTYPRQWGLGPTSQKTKLLVGEGQVDKHVHGRTTANAPKDLQARPDTAVVRHSLVRLTSVYNVQSPVPAPVFVVFTRLIRNIRTVYTGFVACNWKAGGLTVLTAPVCLLCRVERRRTEFLLMRAYIDMSWFLVLTHMVAHG